MGDRVDREVAERVEGAGVECVDVIDNGEPGHSDGGGTQVLGISAIGINHVALRIIPYPIGKDMSHITRRREKRKRAFVVAPDSTPTPRQDSSQISQVRNQAL